MRRPFKPWEPGETGCEYIDRLEATIYKMHAERLKLDKRIHNQRVQLQENWQIIEKRASHRRAWVRSPLLMSMLRRPRKPWWHGLLWS